MVYIKKTIHFSLSQMPLQLQDLAGSLEIPDMESKVEQSVRQCRQYDTTSTMISMERFRYSNHFTLIINLNKIKALS